MSHADDHRREDLAGYLLGALSSEDALALERHLEGCDACRDELDWLRPAAQVLPEAVEQLAPPAQLRARVLGEARADLAPPGARQGLGGRLSGRRLAALAAAALVAAALGGYAVRGGGSGTPRNRCWPRPGGRPASRPR